MTIEELISEAARRGLRVNNLCQLPDFTWQANLTDGERFWEFGKGQDPQSALVAALHKHSTTAPELGLPQGGGLYKPTPTRAPKGRLVL